MLCARHQFMLMNVGTGRLWQIRCVNDPIAHSAYCSQHFGSMPQLLSSCRSSWACAAQRCLWQACSQEVFILAHAGSALVACGRKAVEEQGQA